MAAQPNGREWHSRLDGASALPLLSRSQTSLSSLSRRARPQNPLSASVNVPSSSSYTFTTTSVTQGGTASELSELLRCLICFGQVNEPRLCPTCSKMCCLSCISRWLERKSECPCCRSPLSPSMLVNCRFMHDIYAELERMQSLHSKTKEDQCPEHEAPMYYFCKTCKNSICSDCAMFKSEHKGHEFERLSKVYQENVDTVQSQIDTLKSRMKDLALLEHRITSNMNAAQSAQQLQMDEMDEVLKNMKDRLRLELKTKLESLNRQRNDVVKEENLLESLHHELKCQLDVSICSQTELIKKTPDLLKMLQEINAKPTSEFFHTEESTDFRNELVPAYKTAVFTIEDFAAARDRDIVMYSPSLVTTGLTWRLKVYPNGNGIARYAYISVFLELSSGFQGTSTYDYRVNMLHSTDRSKSVSRVFASTFEVGECWGYNRFFRIDCLEEEGFINDRGELKLEFSVRAPNFYRVAQDQQRYIEYLEGVHRDAQSAADMVSADSAVSTAATSASASAAASLPPTPSPTVEPAASPDPSKSSELSTAVSGPSGSCKPSGPSGQETAPPARVVSAYFTAASSDESKQGMRHVDAVEPSPNKSAPAPRMDWPPRRQLSLSPERPGAAARESEQDAAPRPTLKLLEATSQYSKARASALKFHAAQHKWISGTGNAAHDDAKDNSSASMARDFDFGLSDAELNLNLGLLDMATPYRDEVVSFQEVDSDGDVDDLPSPTSEFRTGARMDRRTERASGSAAGRMGSSSHVPFVFGNEQDEEETEVGDDEEEDNDGDDNHNNDDNDDEEEEDEDDDDESDRDGSDGSISPGIELSTQQDLVDAMRAMLPGRAAQHSSEDRQIYDSSSYEYTRSPGQTIGTAGSSALLLLGAGAGSSSTSAQVVRGSISTTNAQPHQLRSGALAIPAVPVRSRAPKPTPLQSQAELPGSRISHRLSNDGEPASASSVSAQDRAATPSTDSVAKSEVKPAGEDTSTDADAAELSKPVPATE